MNLRQIITPPCRIWKKRPITTASGWARWAATGNTWRPIIDASISAMPDSLSFSALDHQPVQVAAFATVEWVRDLAREMRAQGKVLMANCSWGFTPGWLTFAAPYLDVFGAEATEFADPDFIRAIANRKPCTDLPYKPRPAWEVPRHWLHAIHPGHGNDLEAMRQSVGVLRELLAAGWEPIPGARQPEQRASSVTAGSRIYLVLHNPTKQPTWPACS